MQLGQGYHEFDVMRDLLRDSFVPFEYSRVHTPPLSNNISFYIFYSPRMDISFL